MVRGLHAYMEAKSKEPGEDTHSPGLLNVDNLDDVRVVDGLQQADLSVDALGGVEAGEDVVDLLDGHPLRWGGGVVHRFRNGTVRP